MVELDEPQRQFIESMGLHFETMGIPRIGGRVLGLLLLAERPLMLEEIAELLRVSRASVSTNTRFFLQFGLLAPHSVPGDRRRYYVFHPRAWEVRLGMLQALTHELRRLTAEGMEAAGGPVAKARLAGAQDFATFMEENAIQMGARWRQRTEG